MTTIYESAVNYLARGWSVHPLKPKNKIPLAGWKQWQTQYATSDEIALWFDGTDNNIGIVAGKISNLTIVDCDNQEAIEFFESRDFVPTLQVRTAHGCHYFYQFVEGSNNFQARKDWPGIDLRSEGGYVVGPSSIHPEGPVYAWANDLQIAIAPAWLFDSTPQSEQKDTEPGQDSINDLFAPASLGQRNMSLTRLAGLILRDSPFGVALSVCKLWNERNDPPLPYDELLRTVQSVAAKETKKGGTAVSIHSFGELQETLVALRETGIPKGVSTGMPSLDENYRIPLRQWSLVTGAPGSGKSSFLSHLMINLMENEGWKFVIFSAENLPIEHYAARLIACYLKKPFYHGYHERLTQEDMLHGLEFLDAHCQYIDASGDALTVGSIIAALQVKKATYDFQGVVLDPWNEMRHTGDPGKLETNIISDELGVIRKFARNYNVHLWVVAHPRIMHRNRDGEHNIVTPYDVAGSSHFNNKADFCITVHRDFKKNMETEIHIQKVRFSENGRLGMVSLGFDASTGRYYEIGESCDDRI